MSEEEGGYNFQGLTTQVGLFSLSSRVWLPGGQPSFSDDFSTMLTLTGQTYLVADEGIYGGLNNS